MVVAAFGIINMIQADFRPRATRVYWTWHQCHRYFLGGQGLCSSRNFSFRYCTCPVSHHEGIVVVVVLQCLAIYLVVAGKLYCNTCDELYYYITVLYGWDVVDLYDGYVVDLYEGDVVDLYGWDVFELYVCDVVDIYLGVFEDI